MKKNLFLVPFLALTATALIFTFCNKSAPFTPTGLENLSQVTTHTHGFGCNLLPKDQYNKIPLATKPLAKTSTGTMMAAATVLTLDCPPVGDQGQQGSCTAWGTTYAARSISWHYKMGGSWSTATNIFSPAYVYNQTKVSDCNSGAYTTSALDLLKSQGACRWNLMTYTDQDCGTMPNSSQTADAANFKIPSYSRVGLTTDSIKSFLASSKAVVVAGPVNNAFESLGNGAVLTSFTGSSLGGHCYCVVGYDDGKQAFKFLNSWGTSWATSGYGYISYNYITSWWQEAYVVNDSSVSLPGQASSPSPSNSATGVNTAPTLSWTTGSSATSHDVYFGTSNPPSLKGNQTATTYSCGTLSANTTYYWRIDEKNSAGTTTGAVWSFTTGSGTNPQSPYNGPHNITSGATLQAEDFDNGGEGVAYHDNDASNNGGAYRTGVGVDIETCGAGGYDVGWTSAGEWMKYTCNVSGGTYNITLYAASPNSGTQTVKLYQDDMLKAAFTVPNTGGWQTYQAITVNGVSLSTGSASVLKIESTTGGYNLDKITIATSTSQYTITASAGSNGSISPSGSVVVNSGSSQAFTITANSGYKVGVVTVDGVSQGAITSYTFSNVTANHTISATFVMNLKIEEETGILSGGANKNTNHANYSGTGFVDGYYASTTAKDSITVNAPVAGSYKVTLHYSAGNGASSNTGLYVNGTKLKNISCPATTNWDAWSDETETVTLKAGNNGIVYKAETSSASCVNLDYIVVAQ